MDELVRWMSEERDRRAIEEIIKRYFAMVDRRELNLLDALFAPDGKMWIGDKLMRGPGAAPMGEALEAIRVPGKPLAASHLMHHCIIELQGDAAKSETFAVSYLALEGRSDRMLVRGLRYLDRFQRLPSGWRIQERWHNLDWVFEGDATHVLPQEARKQLSGI